MIHIFHYLALLGLVFVVLACANQSDFDEQKDLTGQWQLVQIVYEDDTANIPDSANYVTFTEDTIVESISGFGNRLYPYSRKGNNLNLTVGGEQVVWTIKEMKDSELEILTPIGLYVLRR